METEQEFAARMGAAIRQARAARKWSQATLAERLDVSVDYVGMLERGERLPSVSVLFQVATLFGMSVLELITAPTAESWAAEAVALLRVLPDGSRSLILTMLRAAAAEAPTQAKRAREKKRSR